MRRTYRRRKQGGFIQQLGNAVYSGVKQGIKNAPKEIYSSLKSSGSSYLTPTGSIANYAGNNIQNIIKSHNETFRKNMGNKMNTLRTTLKNKNKKPIAPMKYPIMPYSFKRAIPANVKLPNSRLMYNNKYMPIMSSIKNNKNLQNYNNKGLLINTRFNNKTKQQQQLM